MPTMSPRPCLFFFDDDAGHNHNNQFSPPKSMPMAISRGGGGGDDGEDGMASKWPFHSFSAPCPAAGYLDELFAQHNDGNFLFCHPSSPSAPFRPYSAQAKGGNKFVRSQSESAALNKLAQMNQISRVPHSLLDEFQLAQSRLQHFRQFQHGQENGQAGGESPMATSANGQQSQSLNGMKRGEVKFFAQHPPLQSDSEGEDSLVSTPDEEASPSNSCNEEDEEEGGAEKQNETPMVPPTIGQFEEEEVGEEEEDLGLGPMDEEIERDRDRIAAAHSFHQQDTESQQLMPLPGFLPLSSSDAAPQSYAAASDYVTVPRLLASLDIAQPAQPSPMVHLPLHPTSIDLVSAAPVAYEKSALVIKEEEEAELVLTKAEDVVIPLRCPKKPKRCVRFADDCGQCLETVRVMTEPSDYPPKISPAVLRRCRRAAAQSMQKESDGQCSPGSGQTTAADDDSDELDSDDSEKRPRSTWKLGFKQPASEYVKFRETLDSQKVALENVMLKNEQNRMIGTIKVSNIAFEKRVFVRYSDNGWRTFTDKPAQYQSSPSKTFDTFRFDIEIPRNEDNQNDARLEFCVCYMTNDGQQEYWDSNLGHNFVLLSPNASPASPLSPGYDHHKFGGRHQQQSKPRPIMAAQTRLDRDDAYRMDWNSPTGYSSTHFASWRQLSTDGPYWSCCTPPLTPIRFEALTPPATPSDNKNTAQSPLIGPGRLNNK